jgi:hypothetical protein
MVQRELHRAIVGPPEQPGEECRQAVADPHASRSRLAPDELLGDQAASIYHLLGCLGRITIR